jgi:predicted TIM-barrel fold metal-dependent hydrolase
MYVDIHIHLIVTSNLPDGYISPRLWRGITARGLRWYLKLSDKPKGKLLDQCFVSRLVQEVRNTPNLNYGVILALDGVYNSKGEFDLKKTHFYVSNDVIFKIHKKYPFLLPGASINPQRKDAIDELWRVKEKGAVLIKWLPSAQGFNPADRKIKPFLKELTKAKLPLLVHTGYEHILPVFTQSLGDPGILLPILEQGITTIAAHSGSSGILHPKEYFYKFLDMLEQFPNLYGDIAAFLTPVRYPYLKRVLNSSLCLDRLIYGSDWPIPIFPLLFLDRLSLKQIRMLYKEKNFISRSLKSAIYLGVPDQILKRGNFLFSFPRTT